MYLDNDGNAVAESILAVTHASALSKSLPHFVQHLCLGFKGYAAHFVQIQWTTLASSLSHLRALDSISIVWYPFDGSVYYPIEDVLTRIRSLFSCRGQCNSIDLLTNRHLLL